MIEQKEKVDLCPNCGAKIEDDHYIYRHKAPSGYQCSKCGFYYLNNGK